jgi:hypothetical protein
MRVFISHVEQDEAFAEKLKASLIAQNIQASSVMDITPGESLTAQVYAAIEASDAVLPVISKASSSSLEMSRDISIALSEQLDDRRKRIIPIKVKNSASLPFFLKDTQGIDFSSRPFDVSMELLIGTLQSHPQQKINIEANQKLKIQSLHQQRSLLEAQKRLQDQKQLHRSSSLKQVAALGLIVALITGSVAILATSLETDSQSLKDIIALVTTVLTTLLGYFLGYHSGFSSASEENWL